MKKRFRIRPNASAETPAEERPSPRQARAKLLVSIVNLRDEKKFKEILDGCSAGLSYEFPGTGTARSAVLDYIGIGETKKAVIFSLFPESDEEKILRMLRTEMSLYLAGKGISFTVPLTGISQTVAEGIMGATNNKWLDGSKVMKSTDRKYDLIIACVGANFVDTAIEAARGAGAAGGTIIRGHAMENAKAEQFVGVSLVKEQETLLILSRKEATLCIMTALSEKVGAQTEAAGVIFSVPVDRTAGVSAAEEEELGRFPEKEENA